jgi:hypothetical protein
LETTLETGEAEEARRLAEGGEALAGAVARSAREEIRRRGSTADA